MKVLVCGGRNFSDKAYVKKELALFEIKNERITHIISGGARGVDSIAVEYATDRGIPFTIVLPNWEKYGKKAGIIRNMEMLDNHNPDMVIAFPGGNGTAHMTKYAEKKGVEVYYV